jgi:hypothetical protein
MGPPHRPNLSDLSETEAPPLRKNRGGASLGKRRERESEETGEYQEGKGKAYLIG